MAANANTEVTTPLVVNEVKMETTDNGKKESGVKKHFGGIDKSRLKSIPNAIKKKRANFRLRKIIQPKPPCMILNEMIGGVSYNFFENVMAAVPTPAKLTTAECEIDGNKFSGSGPSKQIAKNICAEHAIQYVVMKKSQEQKNKLATVEVNNEDGTQPKILEDETPWTQLSSLALFKMFNDWQAQGFNLPPEFFNQSENSDGTIKATTAMDGSGSAGGTPKPAKKMPENPTQKHPVQLLNELRGQTFYSLEETRGVAPNYVFVMSTIVDGRTFRGEGKNKKEAKKACAQEVLKELHNVIY